MIVLFQVMIGSYTSPSSRIFSRNCLNSSSVSGGILSLNSGSIMSFSIYANFTPAQTAISTVAIITITFPITYTPFKFSLTNVCFS